MCIKDWSYGDFVFNIVMIVFKVVGMKLCDLVEKIFVVLFEVVDISKVEIVGFGFINFFLNVD